MAVITPDTDVILLKVPLEMDEKNQLTFASSASQYTYFSGLPKKSFDKFTYQRKDNTITVPGLVDSIRQYNYVMYRNNGFNNTWFYAFITDMQFLSPSSTSIKIKTDVWQTWQFGLTYKPVFVEREHVNSDTVGEHTVPEGLECGEYVMNGSPSALAPSKVVKDSGNTAINTEILICFQVSKFIDDYSFTVGGKFYNRQYSGLTLFAVSSKADADKIISGFIKAGKIENIVSIFMAPKEFFDGSLHQSVTFTDEQGTSQTVYIYLPAESSYASTLLDTTTVSRNTTIDGYSPKNNKLFTYPYNYLYATNNAGADTIYRYEDFLDATPKFYMGGTLGQGCSIKLAPVNYKHLGSAANPAENYPYGITGMKYPVCAWASDYYTNWLTQNAVNMGVNIFNKTLSAGVNGALSGNPAIGAATAGTALVTSVLSTVGEMDKASKMPDQAYGNTNCSDVGFAWRRMFTLNRMSVRAEYARIIDEFFSMFGYKINRVKTPNITGRLNWNYVKTIGCYIRADIPQEDLLEIQSMFDKGVTFWHNASTFGDYSQNNGIVS